METFPILLVCLSIMLLFIMGLSPHGLKMAATATGFIFLNAKKGRKQCISQYIKKELLLQVSLLLLIQEKLSQKSPAQNWTMGPLLRVRDVGTVSTLPVVEVGGKSEKGWHVACQQHLPHLPYPGTCPNAPRKHPYGRVTEQF